MADRILTTHAGALPRSPELTGMIRTQAMGQKVDDTRVEELLVAGVAEAVRMQVEYGIDSINDGELSKSNFMHYVASRISGWKFRQYSPGEGPEPLSITARDRTKFPDYFLDGRGGFASGGKDGVPAKIRRYECIEPLRYIGAQSMQRDIANFRAGLKGVDGHAPFLPAVTLGVIEHWLYNEHYKTQEEFLYAIGDVMHEEYKAIIDAGFILQLDDPDLADGWQMYPHMSVDDYRRYAIVRIDALNHALRGLPRERIRLHVCWGSYHGPHEFDIPLKDIVDLLFRVNAGAVSIEAANPRHEHEWQVFEDFKLPKDTKLIPGVVGHCTDFIEHPELVAQRLERYGKLVGLENLMASTDCGLGNRTGTPSIAWAKLEALVEGAKIATKRLRG